MSDSDRFEVVARGQGRFDVQSGPSRRLAHAVRAGMQTWVFLEGRVYVIAADGPPAGQPRHQDDAATLAAPMPATVVSISVAPGDRVEAGDLLVTLEAMKMELAIRSPRAATVRRLACQPGELVQPGVPLVELD